jgi:hypothetical protein
VHKNKQRQSLGDTRVGFLTWLEETGLAEWVRVSATGYPMMITAHSIGLAVMVGPAVVLDLRLLGMFGDMPLESFHKLLKVAWIGFLINFLSGAALFTTQAVSYVTNVPFLIKIAFVLLGAIMVAQQQGQLAREARAWTDASAIPNNARAFALASLIFWIGAIITGRLIAYL